MAVVVAAAGLGLMGSSFSGLVQVDGTLQAATREQQREHEQLRQRTIDVKQHRPPGCPADETRQL